MGTLSGDVVRPAPRLGPRLVHASSSCGADGRFAVGAAGALKDFPVCQRATQAMSRRHSNSRMGLARHRGKKLHIVDSGSRPRRLSAEDRIQNWLMVAYRFNVHWF